MWSRKELKKRAKHSFKINYIACVAVCFIMVFVAGEYQNTIQFISEYNTNNVSNLKFDTDEKLHLVKEVERLVGGKNQLKELADSKINEAVDDIAEKYDIDDKEAMRSWVDAYISQGAAALNYKEVTMGSSVGENSNWRLVSNTIESIFSNSDNIKIDTDSGLTEAEVSYFFDLLTKEDTSKIGVINYVIRLFSEKVTWRVIFALLGSLITLLFAFFVAGPLIVGERRFFIENHTYKKTRIGRIGFLFKERCYKPIITMLFMDLYTFLWSLTIVFAPIKRYEYEMIPYILAENPRIQRKKAFKLSKQMMKGNKWKSFLIDLSFAPWIILVAAVFSLFVYLIFGFNFKSMFVPEAAVSLLLIFFLNPYRVTTKTELYFVLRREAIEKGYEFSEELNDKYIDLDMLQEEEQKQEQEKEKSLTASSLADN